MRKSFGTRSIELLSLAARVGAREAAQRWLGPSNQDAKSMEASRLKQAQAIVESLSQLKGAAMKVGQLLSIDAGDYFPPEAIEVLSRLQAQAEPVPFRQLEPVLIEDLGLERFRDFKNLNRAPVASASIGQVHRAELQGESVALKIQYPGVAESIDADVNIVRKLGQTLAQLSGRQEIELAPVFEELRRVLHQEADYRIELQALADYRRHADGLDGIRVPLAIESHSGRRVLTMSWENGVSLDDWMRSKPPLARRERLARAMLDLFCREFFLWGLVQTDPNFANFLISQRDELVLLDFGATLRYDEDFRQDYTRFLRTMGGLDREAIWAEGIRFGLLDEREGTEARENFYQLMCCSVEPFFVSRQPFAFEDIDYARRTREAGQKFAMSLKYSAPPHHILFLHRKLGGLFNFVKRLDVRLDLTEFWQRMVGGELPAR
jgi:aarF domain-containing kinase